MYLSGHRARTDITTTTGDKMAEDEQPPLGLFFELLRNATLLFSGTPWDPLAGSESSREGSQEGLENRKAIVMFGK